MPSTIGPCRVTRCGERDFRSGITPADEPLEELPVSQPGDGVAVEERLNLPANRSRRQICHVPRALDESLIRPHPLTV